MLADARALVDRFHAMIRKKAEIELEPWIDESKRSLIASFATGIANDKGAVHAAITQPWSNVQVEAQITKLKLVKRQMYGAPSSISFRADLSAHLEPQSIIEIASDPRFGAYSHTKNYRRKYAAKPELHRQDWSFEPEQHCPLYRHW
jgi:hypothetical protein